MRHNKSSLSWVIAFLPCIAAAAEGEFALIAGVGNSNNIDRVLEGKRQETIASLGTEFSIQKDTRAFRSNLVGDLAWVDYLEGSYKSEVTGFAGVDLGAELIGDVLSWSLSDRFGQTSRDLIAAPTPANREYINQFSTGPDLSIPLTTTMDLVASGRYLRVDYEDSDIETRRFVQTLALQRELASGGFLGISVASQRINPEQAEVYRVDEAVLSYQLSGSRTDVRLEGGATRMHGRGRAEESGALFRMNISRTLGRRSTVTLSGGRQITDSGGSLGGWQDASPPPGSGNLGLSQTSEPFVEDTARLGWRIEGRITSLEAAGSWVRENFPESDVMDRRERSLMLSASRQLGAKLTATASLRHTSRDRGPDDAASEGAASIDLQWRLGRRLSVLAEGEFTRFKSGSTSDSARENRIWLRIRHDSWQR